MSDTTESDTIDPKTLIKRLAPDQLGLYEPLSGLVLLNVTDKWFLEVAQRWQANACSGTDIALIHTINHETYHFAQVAASGYMFDRQRLSFEAFCSMGPPPEFAIDPETAQTIALMREHAAAEPELNARADRLIAMLAGHQFFATLEERASEGDHSLIGAMHPGFFKHLDQLAEREMAKNASGLSIRSVLEGSAVVHANLLMHAGGNATVPIETELATLAPVYAELYENTRAQVGERTLELLLPTVALALRYAEPHMAYAPLLQLVAECQPGEALVWGQTIAAALPAIAEAGRVLGTAIDVRRQHAGYRFYDDVLKSLEIEQWGVDSYAFLADPAAMHKVESFPLGMITQDGYRGALDKIDLVARMMVMSAVLRVQSRRAIEREFRTFQVEWARDVIGRCLFSQE